MLSCVFQRGGTAGFDFVPEWGSLTKRNRNVTWRRTFAYGVHRLD